jgi:AraC family transcriptional regulator
VSVGPPREPPRLEYARRMHRVQRHIDEHLDQPLELADLAAVANFSPYHFHRLFTAWMGETLGEYLRRRRLEVAALRLLSQPRTPLLQIALMVGFGSNEAFAHAFKARFGCSASAWRKQQADVRSEQQRKPDQAFGNPDQVPGCDGIDDGGSSTRPPETAMNVTVTTRTAVRIAYLRHVGPYGAAVAAFWQSDFYPFLSRHGLHGRSIYGISHDDPAICAPEKCRYDVGVEIDEQMPVLGDAHIGSIPAGTYAALPFKGTPETIAAAWQALMRDWLPASGWQLDGRPTFEHYRPDAVYDDATGSFSCDIVIPLAPL